MDVSSGLRCGGRGCPRHVMKLGRRDFDMPRSLYFASREIPVFYEDVWLPLSMKYLDFIIVWEKVCLLASW